MGLNPGKKDKNLADMSEPIEASYDPPDPADCNLDSYTFIIDEALNGSYRMHHYDGKIVDFSVSVLHDEQTVRDDRNIVRSDCKHSCIHRHAYRRDGTDMLGGKDGKGTIPIPPAPKGYAVVDMHYDEEYTWAIDGAHEHYERWRRS